GVLWEGLFEAVAFDRAPVLGVDRLVLPDQRINQIGAGQIGAMNDNFVGVAAERTIHGSEGARFGRRKLEANRYEMPARAFLEVVPAVEDLARPGREHGLAPPIKLDAAEAIVSDDRRAQIGAWQLRRGRRGALDRVIDGAVDRLEREACAVQIHLITLDWKCPPRPLSSVVGALSAP